MTGYVDNCTEHELADRLARKVLSQIEWPCKLIHVSFNTDISNEQYRITVVVEPKEVSKHGQTNEH